MEFSYCLHQINFSLLNLVKVSRKVATMYVCSGKTICRPWIKNTIHSEGSNLCLQSICTYLHILVYVQRNGFVNIFVPLVFTRLLVYDNMNY